MVEEEDNIDSLPEIPEKLMEYRRPIMIVGFIILILLVVYLGFAYGSARVCDQMDGMLDSKLVCHPSPSPREVDNVGQRFILPDTIFNES